MRKIKLENIFLILSIIFNILQLKHHIKLNGLYINLIVELIINTMFISILYYIIKDIRKNPKNWTL